MGDPPFPPPLLKMQGIFFKKTEKGVTRAKNPSVYAGLRGYTFQKNRCNRRKRCNQYSGENKMDEYDKMLKNLDILRKNRENVPESVLRSKYKAAYMGLRKEIEDEANFFITEWGKMGRYFLNGDEDAARDYFQKFQDYLMHDLEEKGRDSICKRMHRALYEHYDFTEFLNICADMYEQTVHLYRPYWGSKCRVIDGHIYNDIIGYWWEEESGCWIRQRKDGSFSFTIMIPAPDNLRKEVKKRA